MTKPLAYLRVPQFKKPDKFFRRFLRAARAFIVVSLPGLPFYMDAVNQSIAKTTAQYYPSSYAVKKIGALIGPGGNQSPWFIDYREYFRLGKKIVGDKPMVRRMAKDYQAAYDKLFILIRRLEERGIDQKNWQDDFLHFLDVYLQAWGKVYILTGQVVPTYGDYFIQRFLRQYGYSDSARRAVIHFSEPLHNFVRDEENDLQKLTVSLRSASGTINSLASLRRKRPDIYRALAAHQRKYYWIHNNYQKTYYLNLNFFWRRLYSWPGKKIYTARHAAPAFGKIKPADLDILKFLGQSASWQDMRKKANILSNYWLRAYLQAITKKFKLSVADLEYSSVQEVLRLLETGRIDIKAVRARQRGLFFVTFRRRDYWLTGADYRRVKSRLESLTAGGGLGRKMLRGRTASPGLARGRARIILNVAQEKNRLKPGDILVSSMTRPEFVPLMKRAGAVITQEGGITSHAAVISRELGIPCVLGVKNVLKIVKDGDWVEVDASRGTVKILNRHS